MNYFKRFKVGFCILAVFFLFPIFIYAQPILSESETIVGQTVSGEEVDAMGFKEFICYRDFFRVKVPAEWEQYEEILMADETKEYGIDLKGPANKDGAFTSITIIYYGPDHGRMTMEKFIELNAHEDESLKIEGEKYGEITSVVVAGETASQFDTTDFLFLPIYAVEQMKIPMLNRTIVLKGKKGGFYVLEYSSPEDSFAQYLRIFMDVLASFNPKA